jgi:CelD/BcsL family acetyltransferase involved in cellulose biosynthesis
MRAIIAVAGRADLDGVDRMTSVEVLEDMSGVERIADEWDRLAVACSLPLCAPGWMLSWWQALAPAGARLRVVTVRCGGELIGLAPWFLQEGARLDLRPLGAEYSDRVDLLGRPGAEREVAAAMREALLGLGPDLISFEAVPGTSPWRRLLASGPRGRLRLSVYSNSARPAPVVTLPAAPAGAWLEGRSSNFRGQMRRMRRNLEKRGGTVRRVVEPAEVSSSIAALLDLHRRRWDGRGETKLSDRAAADMLVQAARALGPDRLRLWQAEIDSEPISVQLFLAAGTELKYWNGGWAEEHAALKPSMLTILAALEDAIERGEKRLDLGVGRHPYKLRFADSEDTLTWGGLIVRNRRWPRTRAELAPRVARYRAKQVVEALPAGVRGRLEAIRRRERGEED